MDGLAMNKSWSEPLNHGVCPCELTTKCTNTWASPKEVEQLHSAKRVCPPGANGGPVFSPTEGKTGLSGYADGFKSYVGLAYS